MAQQKAPEFKTKYVFILVIDGPRYAETYGEPTCKYSPLLCDSLKKEGTFYAQFKNNGPHIEPRDIFNYLNLIPHVMRGKRLCVFHHTNILSDLGWEKFLSEWQNNLLGQRHGCAFSVMTDKIMEKFLHHLNYEVILQDTKSVPRDCVWICKASYIF